TATKAANQTSSAVEPNTTASPARTKATPLIIGLRTWRYGPRATSFAVGSQGASVPSPIVEKSRIVHTTNTRPTAIGTTPTALPHQTFVSPVHQRISPGPP